MSDEHPCSGCPFLDLGHEYPVKDERDPWRRMPELFTAASRIFGLSFANRKSRGRERAEKLLRHYCWVTRDKHGQACTPRRSRTCRGIVREALDYGATAPTVSDRYARTTAALRRAVNSEETQAAIRATIVRPVDGPLKVKLRTVPSADTYEDAA